ncbi:NEDD8-activating enzyme E1 catalytic subunit, partial [Schistosoma japonicum]
FLTLLYFACCCLNHLGLYIFLNFSTHLFAFKLDCLVCNNVPRTLTFHGTCTLNEVIEYLKTNSEFRMQSTSITIIIEDQHCSLYIDLPELVDTLKPNLSKSLKDLVLIQEQLIYVSDVTTPRTFSFKLQLEPKDSITLN